MFQKILFIVLIIIAPRFFSADKKDTVVVSQDKNGDFSCIQEAIDQSPSFPYGRLVIKIKNGIYKEKITLQEWNTNITFIGEDRDKTVITFDDYFSKLGVGRNSTFFTSTFWVNANDTVLKNLTIENSSGEVGQAIALSISANRVAVVDCRILGNQDTLYLGGEGKQFFKNCYISGTTDFIFGNATAFFENCKIHSKKDSYITASSTPENTEFGFVFSGCALTAESGIAKVFLGRPWRIFAKTAFLQCYLGKHILPEAWDNWDKPDAEKKSFYAEFQNVGEGANTKKRVGWSRQLTESEATKFNKKNVLNDSKKINWYEGI